MPSLAQTVAGTTLGITSSLPATYNQAGFSALTYTTVAEITDLSTLGKEYSLVTHNPVG